MHITGIIAEYNPFHNGHQYQLEQIRKNHPDTIIAAVMSGSFLQRGTAALLDKWTRAELAVKGGCDVVFELPFAFACRSAQDFARGGVQLLARLGVIDTLAFGAECSSLTTLTAIATAIDSPAVQTQLHERISAGASYAQALTELTASEARIDASLLHTPNNILAIEYLRALKKTPAIEPLLIPRAGASYHNINIAAPHASASAIRQLLSKAAKASHAAGGKLLLPQLTAYDSKALQEALPAAGFAAIRQLNASELPNLDRLLVPLQALMLRTDNTALQEIAGINEGLENRLRDCLQTTRTYNEVLTAATTKRYPKSRIARTLIHLLLGLTQTQLASMDDAGPLYARILACGPRGRDLLKRIKKAETLPLITKTSAFLTSSQRVQGPVTLSPLQQQLALDTMATDLRQLTLPQATQKRNDFQQSPRFFTSNPPADKTT
ncbi:tRNA(Met) cytidine acetate ligase [Selenomonas ruminis]|uniref:tRNA(Met) cytidine acetate ligase n=1 Tax=Selenomonas ruminis TaxID=2593411 RepID=A0A5D6VVN4_9FIRM|nr:nucleotidyltransferase family protein [Selenomonas sp. mPRGC5]TYZ19726.1 nucleotidyltransferase family protein [Selenomonas sp. mPRGC5]